MYYFNISCIITLSYFTVRSVPSSILFHLTHTIILCAFFNSMRCGNTCCMCRSNFTICNIKEKRKSSPTTYVTSTSETIHSVHINKRTRRTRKHKCKHDCATTTSIHQFSMNNRKLLQFLPQLEFESTTRQQRQMHFHAMHNFHDGDQN